MEIIMKKMFKYALTAAVVALTVVSCDIERFPYNQIEQTQAFQTMKDAQTINNGMYSQTLSRVYGIFMHSTDVQADLFNASLDFGNRQGFPHRWEGFLSTDYTIRDVWRGYYSALVNVNNIIQNMGKVTTATDAEKATLNGYLGEAYLMRAFYYHQLVIRWGKPYNSATAATDLGVPLILTFDPTLKPSRATVQKVYEQIIADIAEAKRLMPDVAATPNKKKLNKDAAFALEARVYLHMKDYPKVITAATALINTTRYPLVETLAGMQGMWVNDVSSEFIFQLHAAAPAELPASAIWNPVNNIYLGLRPSDGKFTPDFIPQQWIVDLYDVADIRRSVYLQPKNVIVQGADYPGLFLFTKYSGNPALFTAATTNYQHKPVVFRIAETYLNLIEAQYFVDPAAALISLNSFRSKRGLGPVALTGAALLAEIKNERVRELLGEGMRLNDLMRWGDRITRRAPQLLGPINVAPGDQYHQLDKAANDYQTIWGIPANDMTTNPNIVQNQDW
jgi:hypothetical protein